MSALALILEVVHFAYVIYLNSLLGCPIAFNHAFSPLYTISRFLWVLSDLFAIILILVLYSLGAICSVNAHYLNFVPGCRNVINFVSALLEGISDLFAIILTLVLYSLGAVCSVNAHYLNFVPGCRNVTNFVSALLEGILQPQRKILNFFTSTSSNWMNYNLNSGHDLSLIHI